MITKHTPIPWHLGLRAGSRAIYGPYGEEICVFTDMTLPEEESANADFIIRAVNNHEKLVATLRELSDGAMNTPVLDSADDWTELIVKANRLLEVVERGAK